MCPKRQAPKSGWRPRQGPLKPDKLTRSLRTEWRRGTPERPQAATIDHIQRAREVPLPPNVTEDSLAAQAMRKYFDERERMTEQRAAELGMPTPSAATKTIVFDHFIPDTKTADLDTILEVAHGLDLARLALRTTLNHEINS